MYFIVNDLYYLYEKTSYNQLGRLKIYINDVLVSESTEVEGWSPMEESNHISPNLYVNPGEYRIRVENKYGLSAEKTITIN